MNNSKRSLGQYFTKHDLWLYPQVEKFILESASSKVLDPFAGAGDLLQVAKNMIPDIKTYGLDIDPSLGWDINDGLDSIPMQDKSTIVITNPPYFSKVSASKMKNVEIMDRFSNNSFRDIYQLAMDKVMKSVKRSVWIIPETFLSWVPYPENVCSVSIVEPNPFNDTDTPVCVVCIDMDKNNEDFPVFLNSKKVSTYKKIKQIKNIINKVNAKGVKVKFNDISDANIGVVGFDGVNGIDKIKFNSIKEFDRLYGLDKIKRKTSRAYYVATYPGKITDKDIKNFNILLNSIRTEFSGVILSPFKSNDKNEERRRRLDFSLASYIIKSILND